MVLEALLCRIYFANPYVGEIEDTIGSIGVSGLCTLGKPYNLGDMLDVGLIFLACSFVI